MRPESADYGQAVIAREIEGFVSYGLYAGNEERAKPEGVVADKPWSFAQVIGEAEVASKAWTHMALTSDGETLRLYEDGELIDSAPAKSAQVSEGLLLIGADPNFAEGFFDGLIDEVRIYDRALPGEEIEEDMASAIQTPPSEQPVASYSFDEGEGEVAHDSSGEHDGTVEGAEWVGGKYGDALKFSREAESSVAIPASPELDLTGAFTLEAWVRPDADQYEDPVIARETEGFVSYGLYAGNAEQGKPEGVVADKPWSFAQAIGEEELPAKAWTHLALTSDGETLRLYEGAELIDSAPAKSAQFSEGSLRIGSDPDFAENFFDGLIDEVRIYDRALPGEEIEEDMELPVNEFTATISGSPTENQTLVAAPDVWAGSEAVTFDYQWQRCDESGAECEAIEGAGNRKYVPRIEDLGHTLRVKVTVQPGPLDSALSAPTAPIVEEAPESLSAPRIYGHPLPGRTLTGALNEWTPSGTTLKEQWRRCESDGGSCEDIAGAEARDYVAQSADVGHTLRFVVTGTTSGGSITAASVPTETVQSPLLENTSLPSIVESGGEEGTELVADPGEWSSEGEVSYRYQWQRCDAEGGECGDLPGEDSPSYLPVIGDVGSSFRVFVTALASGERQTLGSPATSAIEAAKPSNASPPTITGKARAGDTLEATGWAWLGLRPLSQALQWKRCNAAGEECEAIPGATESDFELGAEDIGATIRFQVTAESEAGTASALSAATATVAAFAGPAPSLVSPPEVSGETEVGQELTGTAGVWSGATEYEYRWERCDSSGQGCEPIGEATEAGYVATGDDVGSVLRLAVTALAEDESAAYATASTAQTVRVPGAPKSTVAPALAGTAKVGETLTVSSGSWSGTEPITFSYAWQVCELDECAVIDGETGSSYTITAEDALLNVRAVVTARNANGETTSTSAPSSTVDSLVPFEETAPKVGTGDRVGETLSAEPGTWAGEPNISYAYQWQRCDSAGAECAEIGGAESASYELAGADIGGTLRVLVTATNGFGEAAALSAPSAPISAAGGPALAKAPSISGTAEVEEALGADHGGWEGAETYAYQWQRCGTGSESTECANIPGATGASYSATYDDVGASLRVAVSATAAGGTAIAISAPSEEIQPALEPGREEDSLTNLTLPELSGKAEELQTLSATSGSWHSYLSISFKYEWRRCDAAGGHCARIEGATSSAFTLTEADIGATLRAAVFASNGPTGRVVVSKPTGVVAQAKPENTASPTVSGEAEDEAVLAADQGSWSGSGLTFTYQWQRCDAEGEACTDLKGETAEEETYSPDPEDIGSTLRAVVTASNEAGSANSASVPTEVVLARPPENVESPEVHGEAFQDGLLEAEAGSWLGTPEVGFAYQWQRCNAEGGECADIESATEPNYTAEAVDVGRELRVQVTATNGAGSLKADSQPTEAIGSSHLPVLSGVAPSIQGSANDGRTFTADHGAWDGHAPIEFSYQWQRCDEAGEECTNIAKATSSSYTATTTDLGGTIRVEVTASNTSGSASEASEASGLIAAAAPASSPSPTISGGNRPAAELATSQGDWSGSGPLEFAYRWMRCDKEGKECKEIVGQHESTYVLTAEDARKTVRVDVTATNALGSETASSAIKTILPELSTNTSPPTVSGTLVEGKTVTASTGEWTPKPDKYTYQWQRCSAAGGECVNISGQTSSTYKLASSDAGKTIRVRVAAKNEGESESPTAYSSVSELVNPTFPTNLVPPTISTSTPFIGQEMTATTGSWIGEPTLSYQIEWEICTSTSPSSCETAYPVETGLSFTPWATWSFRRFRVRVRAENSHGHQFASSAITELAVFAPPGPVHDLVPPEIEGSAVVGNPLYVNVGEWTGAERWSYEWLRCDEEGEHCEGGASETPEPADIGHTLRVVVTGESEVDKESVTSEPSEVVGPATRPESEAPPEIEGTAEVGETLYSYKGEWEGTPEMRFDYIWKRCNGAGLQCTVISESEEWSPSYEPTRQDIGKTIRLQVTAGNGWGSVTATSAPTTVVPPTEPLANLSPPEVDQYQYLAFGYDYDGWVGEWEGYPEISAQWQRCDPLTAEPETEAMECIDISGATDARNYYPVEADVGFKLRLKVTASSGEEAETLYSEPTSKTVSAGVDEEEGSYTGLPVVGTTIAADSTVSSAAGLPITVDYKFLRVNAESPAEELQDGPSPNYTVVEADLGHTLEVQMTASIWREDEAEVLNTRTITLVTPEVEGMPSAEEAPSVSGEAVRGATLHGEPGKWSGGGGQLDYSFQWRRCNPEGEACVDIVGATSAEYTLTEADLGSTIRLRVKGESCCEIQGVADSEPSEVVASAALPESSEAPTISGEAVELATLEAHPGKWTGSEPLTYSYQWQGCEPESPESCLDIEGETESNIRLDRRVTGESVRVLVTAANAAGEEAAASSLVGPVEQLPLPEPTAAPSMSVLGPPAAGSTLMTDGGAWENADTSELEYQWLRCEGEGEGCEQIEAAANHSYGLGEEDIGFRLEVEVSASNSSGTVSATSELSPEIEKGAGSTEGELAYVRGDTVYLGDLDGESKNEVASCESLTEDEFCQVRGPRIAPNGRQIAVETWDPEGEEEEEEGTVLTMNIDGTDVRSFGRGSDPIWSSDGTHLYILQKVSGEPSRTQLADVSADGSNVGEPTIMFEGAGIEGTPDISPDAASIVYAAREAGKESKSRLYVDDLQEESVNRLELGPEIDEAFDPRFTPNGEQIVFTATSTNPLLVPWGEEKIPFAMLRSLWIVNADGTDLHPLGPSPTPTETLSDGAPSVNGSEIVVARTPVTFVSYGYGGLWEEGQPSIWRYKLDGTEPKALPLPSAKEPSIVWLKTIAGVDFRDCFGDKTPCDHWNRADRLMARDYARHWALTEETGPNPHYPYISGDDCTNFVSQAWHRAGHKLMREPVGHGEWSWWANGPMITPTESWDGVEKFIEQQQAESRRAIDLHELPPSKWRLGDVVVYNWANGGDPHDHLSIVTKANGKPAISQHSTDREDTAWTEMVQKYIPNYVRGIGGDPKEWQYYILRPLYKAANIPPRYR